MVTLDLRGTFGTVGDKFHVLWEWNNEIFNIVNKFHKHDSLFKCIQIKLKKKFLKIYKKKKQVEQYKMVCRIIRYGI